jgi:hypothetical protein
MRPAQATLAWNLKPRFAGFFCYALGPSEEKARRGRAKCDLDQKSFLQNDGRYGAACNFFKTASESWLNAARRGSSMSSDKRSNPMVDGQNGARSEVLITTSSLSNMETRASDITRPGAVFRTPKGVQAPRDPAAEKELDQDERVSRGRPKILKNEQ